MKGPAHVLVPEMVNTASRASGRNTGKTALDFAFLCPTPQNNGICWARRLTLIRQRWRERLQRQLPERGERRPGEQRPQLHRSARDQAVRRPDGHKRRSAGRDACDTDDHNDGLSDVLEAGGSPCASATGATSMILADSDGDRLSMALSARSGRIRRARPPGLDNSAVRGPGRRVHCGGHGRGSHQGLRRVLVTTENLIPWPSILTATSAATRARSLRSTPTRRRQLDRPAAGRGSLYPSTGNYIADFDTNK